MSFIIAPLDKVMGDQPWNAYIGMMQDLQLAIIDRSKTIWKGYEAGGILPGKDQFGLCPLRANEMAHDVSANTLSGTYSFRKNLPTAGVWHTIFDYSLRDDVVHGFAGFAITDEILKILQFRFEMSDRIYPIIDVQEAKSWGSFAILFKVDRGHELVVEPRQRVYVRGYVEATGYQTIVPLGMQAYKTKDLVITET